MKNGFFWILICAALLYALWTQSALQQQAVELPAGPAPLENNRTVPYAQPSIAPQASNPAPTFGGYPCIGDCSEDQAGYRWAEQNGITDPDSCTGKTSSFIEGCRVYARQRSASLLNK